jgi:hypothetical protein
LHTFYVVAMYADERIALRKLAIDEAFSQCLNMYRL